MENLKEYYKHVGRLAYAVAMADGALQPEEREQLRNSVIRDFATSENRTDTSGMNEALYMDFAFEESLNAREDKDTILNNFNKFISSAAGPADAELLRRTTGFLQKIAKAYNKNREELIIETVTNKINKVLEHN